MGNSVDRYIMYIEEISTHELCLLSQLYEENQTSSSTLQKDLNLTINKRRVLKYSRAWLRL